MSFQPVVPMSGYAGWRFLKRTMQQQSEAFRASPVLQRDTAQFRDRIGGVRTAEALVADHTLLKVALGAYGLDADIGNKFFVRKVLEDGTLSAGALSNRLADKSYRALSGAFGFGDFPVPSTALSDFADTIVDSYMTRQFEAAVGEQDPDLRLALNAQRELTALAGKTSSADTLWYSVLGSPPLRQVFEVAFGLPKSFAVLDIDRQVETMRSRAERQFGNGEIAQFADPARIEDLVRLFLIRAQVESTTLSGGSAALTLLQAGRAGRSVLAALY
jgi:hypothetical protein